MVPHTFQELSKTIVALVASIIALVGFFVTVDPELAAAAVAVVIGGLNVVGVFLARNRPEPAHGEVVDFPELDRVG